MLLASQTESTDKLAIPFDIAAFEVIEKLATTIDHSQKTLPGMVVVDVRFEMLSKIDDPSGEECDLYLRGARIAGRCRVLINDFGFIFCY